MFFSDCFISLRYFNQLDITLKVVYRHELICTGNTALFNQGCAYAGMAI